MGRNCSIHSKWRFIVDIPGFADMKFEKVSEIAAEVEVEEMWEGAALLPDKYPGRGTVDNVTMERGSTTNRDDLEWFKSVADFAAGKAAAICSDFKRDIVVIQLDGQQNELLRYTLFGAFPRRLVLGEWDNSSSDKVIRKMEIAYDYPVVS